MNELEDGEVVVETVGGITRIAVRGGMDIANARRLLDVLRQVPDANVDTVVDLAGVERIDASGLQILVALQAAMRRRGHSLRLLRAPEIARRALARAGLEGTLDVGETTPEAHRG